MLSSARPIMAMEQRQKVDTHQIISNSAFWFIYGENSFVQPAVTLARMRGRLSLSDSNALGSIIMTGSKWSVKNYKPRIQNQMKN